MKNSCYLLILTFLFYLDFVESSPSEDPSGWSRSTSPARSFRSSRSSSFASSRSSSFSSSSNILPQQNRVTASLAQLHILQDFMRRNPYRGLPDLVPEGHRVEQSLILPHPAYTVVRMEKRRLHDVLLMYSTRSILPNKVSSAKFMCHPPQHALYVVKKGERIIGYTQTDHELMPLVSRGPDGNYEYVSIDLRVPTNRLVTMDRPERDALGISKILPTNTHFVDEPQKYPDIIIIKVGDHVVGSIVDGVFQEQNHI